MKTTIIRGLLTIILLFILHLSYSQSFSYPVIPETGKRINDFVPANWTILSNIPGDLNNDNIPDAAIVLQYKDSILFANSEADTVTTQPRMLIILFKNSTGNNYRLMEQNHSIILNHDNANMDDPFEEMSITKGILNLKFRFFMYAGSWSAGTTAYKFRYQNGEFVLVGADHYSFHRATQDYEKYSYNFLTKKRSYTKGNDGDSTEKTTWKKIKVDKPETLRTFEHFTLSEKYESSDGQE